MGKALLERYIVICTGTDQSLNFASRQTGYAERDENKRNSQVPMGQWSFHGLRPKLRVGDRQLFLPELVTEASAEAPKVDKEGLEESTDALGAPERRVEL